MIRIRWIEIKFLLALYARQLICAYFGHRWLWVQSTAIEPRRGYMKCARCGETYNH